MYSLYYTPIQQNESPGVVKGSYCS
uniref:Uncharacterized protein n=1 Tax=Anguilla anguilla TaxID=7936 RepID=A0A0E9TJF4_ANGAN